MDDTRKADIVAAVHLVWIFFGLASLPGIFLVSWWGEVAIAYVAVTVLSWPIFGGCALLELEARFRRTHDPATPLGEESFIQHYAARACGVRLRRRTVRVAIYTYLMALFALSLINPR